MKTKRVIRLLLCAALIFTVMAAGGGGLTASAAVSDTFTDSNGIRYQITAEPAAGANGTVEVESNSYSGEITIPATVSSDNTTYDVTSIGDYAFQNCSGLKGITIPNSVTSIGNHAFYSCTGLTSVTIPNSVTSIGDFAFQDCTSLTSITIPNSVTSIGTCVFQDCSSLTSVTIPNSVTSIGDFAFSGCTSLTGITIPNSVTYIGGGAFQGCISLTGIITIPNSVTIFGDGAFEECSSLTGITIPNSVTAIGDGAFYSCSSLTAITIPGSVTSIEDGAFYECSSLSNLYFDGNSPAIGSDVFTDCSASLNFYYKSGASGFPVDGYTCTSDTKTISVDDTVSNGTITPSTTTGIAGETVNLNIAPDAGYTLKSGSLKYTAGSTDTAITGTSFTMPSDDVTVTGAFEAVPVPSFTLADGATNDSTPTWSWSDQADYGYYRYKLDGAADWTSTLSNSYTPSTALSLGAHTLEVEEMNSAGDWSLSASSSVTIDTTAPTVSSSSPTGTGVSLSTAGIGLAFSENVTAVTDGQVNISDGSGAAYTYTISVGDSYVTGSTASIPISAFKNSSGSSLTLNISTTYTVNLVAGAYKDAAGNTAAGGEAGSFTTEDAYHVTFDKNGGDLDANPASATVSTYNGTVTLPTTNPTRSGYTFASWNTKADGTGTAFTAVTPVTANITVFAQWTQNSTGGGDSVSTSNTAADDTTITVSTVNNTTTATIAVTAKTGTGGTALATVTKGQISNALAAAAKKAAAQGADKQIVEISIGGASSAENVSAAIPQTAFNTLAQSDVDALTIDAPVGTVTFDGTALDAINKNASGSVTVMIAETDTSSLTEEEQATIGDRPVYDLSITSGSKTISDFGGGTATVSVPYKLAEDEDASKIVVYYLSDSGEMIMVPNCVYDAATGMVTFATTHFSAYAVSYNDVSFTDVSGWYENYVYFLAARDIISGTGDSKFSPDENITRAQFVTILANLSGDDLSGYTTSTFSDVSTSDWYFKTVQWAYEKGIATGADGKFSPEDNITRQAIAVMIARYAEKVANYTLPETNGAVTFTDSTEIASYASDAVTAMQRAGIISGNSDGSFAPMAYATRAQAATMVARLLQSILE